MTSDPTRDEVSVCYACGALPCDQAHTPRPHRQHTDDINDLVLLGMARDELAAENAALRGRLDAANASIDRANALNEALAQDIGETQADLTEARAHLGAAESAHNIVCGALATATAQLTEARAREAAAWGTFLASADATIATVCEYGAYDEELPIDGSTSLYQEGAWEARKQVSALTPPTDAAAALTARLDAELERAAAEADACPDSHWGPWIANRIRALRRNPKGGKSHD